MKDVLDELESKVNNFQSSIIAEGNNLLKKLTTTFRNLLTALRSISRLHLAYILNVVDNYLRPHVENVKCI